MNATVDCLTPGGRLNVRVARRFQERALGLLATPELGADQGLLIAPCSSIHTLGMRYPIDVAFVDREGRVARLFRDVRAGRVRACFGARGVVELRSGAAERHRLAVGTALAELKDALA